MGYSSGKDSKRGEKEGWAIKKKERCSKSRRHNLSVERAEGRWETGICQKRKQEELSMHGKTRG